MSEKKEIKRLSDKLDALKHKDSTVIQQGNVELIAKHEKEKEKLAVEIERLKQVYLSKLSLEAQQVVAMPFKREITKKEQADMGTLKKSVRGLIVVHPMTALGREMKIKVVTGYAKKAF
ncbi:YibL family ribosome-associated protein [Edaphovirga cremea]|uniref:YibL family ribosome-associated protein n=1 Tax=Edaphovirga cremea TaxID=2267246 RepID=UPI001472B4C4|nr:YibL family ribosome-associated protein [Edaphovirga cremea]